MNFTQFLLQTDAWRMILVEARPGQHITPLTWNKSWPVSFNAWTKRKLITLLPPTADQVDFPVKVPIVADADIGAACRADGFDIRLTAADGTTELPYERESFAVTDAWGLGSPWNVWAQTKDFATGWAYGLFGNWIKPTITADNATAPDGTMTADKIARSHGTASMDGAVKPALPGQVFTASVWLKAGTETVAVIAISTGLDGALVGVQVARISQPLTNTWQRVSVSYTIPSSGVNQVEMGVGFEGGDVGKYYYAWGAQLETNSSMSTASAATGIFWVKSDVAMAGTYIWCYYGNAAAADGADPEAVWDANFKAVYHMKDATTSTILDSTANNNDGAKKGANEPIEAAGKVASGQDFDGVDDYIDCGGGVSLQFGTDDFSVSFSINRDNAYEDWPYYRSILAKGMDVFVIYTKLSGWTFEIGNGASYQESECPVLSAASHENVWEHIVFNFDRDGNVTTYLNGALKDTIAGTLGTDKLISAGNFIIGKSWFGSKFPGVIDEVRVLTPILPSAAWIAYEYANMNPADGGLTWGAEETSYLSLWSTPYIRVVDSVTENDIEYTERFTLAECNSNASSFYYDYDNGLLYLHTSGSDAPDVETVPLTADYTLVALSWRYYCNAHYKDFKAVYPRLTEALLDGGFEEWANATTPDRWSKTETGTSTINREIVSVHGGGYCIRIDVDSSNNYVRASQTHRLLPSGKTRLTVWYKTDTGKTAGLIVLSVGQAVWLQSDGSWAAGGEIILPSTNGVWTKYTLDFTAHPDHTNYIVYAGCGAYGSNATSSSIYFDDISMRIYREDNIYLPYLIGSGSPNIQQAVGEFQDGAMVMEAGTLQFLNYGSWYTEDSDFLWSQKDICIRAGAKASDYDDCEQIFFGLTRPPVVTDNIATIETTDRKSLLFRDVPPLKYDVATYPKLDPNVVGQSIPIIYGEFSRVPAVCIDTDNYVYKICGHVVEEITSVWYDDVVLTETIDYILDEPNGQFTLLFDPQQAFISAGVKGRKCSLVDATYSTNVADIFVDVFVTYSGILKKQLDFASLLDLRAQRTQAHHLYIGSSQVTFEIVRQLQAGAIFHTIPLADGRIAAYRYRTGTTSSTPNIKSVELSNFQKIKDTEKVYRDIEIGYNFDVIAGTWSFVKRTSADVERLHNVKETLSIMTTLKIVGETENIADFYQTLSASPTKRITATVPSKAFSVVAGPGKVVLTKSKLLEDGSEQSVLLDAPYRVTDIKKNLHTGSVDIEAMDDLQSGGSLICEDCYACQVCNEVQSGSCSVCYACELCNTGQVCDECQVCYYCEKCNAAECTSCELCDACQDCDTCQTTQCSVCVNCQVGDVCGACLVCDDCESCDTCENCFRGECTKVG